jgi:glycosyltransferase involved in cell wall biosynthesis
VFLGELVSHKGIQVLLEAFQRVDGDKATLYIGGRGPLEGLVREVCRCCPNIHYPGFVVGEEKKKLLQSADALVVPSLFQDPSPLVILEAQHYGLPVIASRVGGIPELVSDGETGILVDPQDSVQLHRAIERLIQDPGLWSSMHQKMLEKDKSIHGGESYYRSFMNLCREIVTTHRPAR